MVDFTKIEYLKSGNQKQQLAYNVLLKHELLQLLKEFDPILVGTIPIGIDLENSDLDIVCCFSDRAYFCRQISLHFGKEENFKIRERSANQSVVANFWLDGFEIELFAQATPSGEQLGYRHMLIEHQLLKGLGEKFRQVVVQQKTSGLKTEPAFAKLLGLTGDPYEALLHCDVEKIISSGWPLPDSSFQEIEGK
ncbi:MAG TPA: DUF4269 domain-containing protein [Dyadobacter sp.]|jgi:hypothetical protein|nr:DUF4269 domain-containing protein [Dyadobacter sp.]